MEDVLDIFNDDLFDLSNNIDNNLLDEIDSLDLLQDIACDIVPDKKCPIGSLPINEDINSINFNNSYIDYNQNLIKQDVQIHRNQNLIRNNNCNEYIQTSIGSQMCLQDNGNFNSQPLPRQHQNNHHQNRNKQQLRPLSNTSITHMQPILPAAPSNDIIRNPTLAATLIDAKPPLSISNDDEFKYSDTPTSGKRGVRKNSHNAIEKRYRLSINDKIDELRSLLFENDEGKMNKSSVLKRAIERIKQLENENNNLRNENYRLKLTIQKSSTTTNGNGILSEINYRNNISTNYCPSENNNGTLSSSIISGTSPLSSSSHSDDLADNRSSSMSPRSSYTMQKQTGAQQKTIITSTRQLKRPLIYDTNQSSTRYNSNSLIKNEKLARLLLSPSNETTASPLEPNNNNNHGLSYTSSSSSPISNPSSSKSTIQNNNARLPGFLLCTCALFIVSFQPINRIIESYHYQITGQQHSPASRHILQYNSNNDNSINSDSLWSYLILTILQWLLALMLIWMSGLNRKYGARILKMTLVRFFGYFVDPFGLGRSNSNVELALNEINKSHRMKTEQYLKIVSKHKCIDPKSCGKFGLLFNFILLFMSYPLKWLFLHTKKTDKIIDCYLDLYTSYVEYLYRDEIKSQFSFLQRSWSKLFLLYLVQLSKNHSSAEKINKAWFIFIQSVKIKKLRQFLLRKWSLIQKPTTNSVEAQFQLRFISFCKNNHLKSVLNQIKHNNNQLQLPIFDDQLDLYECYYVAFVLNEISGALKKLSNNKQIDDSHKSILSHITEATIEDNYLSIYEYLELWCCLILKLNGVNEETNIRSISTIEQIDELISQILDIYDDYDGRIKENIKNSRIYHSLVMSKSCLRYLRKIQNQNYDDECIISTTFFTTTLSSFSNLLSLSSKYNGSNCDDTCLFQSLLNLSLTCIHNSLIIQSSIDQYKSSAWKRSIYFAQQFLQILKSSQPILLFENKIKEFSELLEISCEINPSRNTTNNTRLPNMLEQSITKMKYNNLEKNSVVSNDNSNSVPFKSSYKHNISSHIISDQPYLSNRTTSESRMIQ